MHEMRESLRIVYQCLNEMPEGPYKSIDGKVAPPRYDTINNNSSSRDDASLLQSVQNIVAPGFARKLPLSTQHT